MDNQKILCYTLGCKLNQMESDGIIDSFRRSGWEIITPSSRGLGEEIPNIIIINTCTVTGKAEQKARRMIRKYLREFPKATVVVTGCFAQLDGEALRDIDPRVLVCSQESKPKLLGMPEMLKQGYTPGEIITEGAFVKGSDESAKSNVPIDSARMAAAHAPADKAVVANPDPYDRFSFTYVDGQRGRPFIKIQDGCNNRCSYCRVPLARGNAVSLPVARVVERVKDVVAQGFQEYVLTGVNLSLYKDGDIGFSGLLRILIAEVPEARIRLSSVEPNYITPDFLEVFANPQICPHIHLPIQSGSNRVLQLSKRKYTREDVIQGVYAIRAIRPDTFIGADIITGLPGEGEEEFLETKKLLEELEITGVHVFPFSPRKGTEFFGTKRVTESVRDNRAKILRELSSAATERYKERMEGKKASPVLVSFEKNFWIGLTEHYLSVKLADSTGYKAGRIVETTYK